MTVDFRHPEVEGLEEAGRRLDDQIARIAEEGDVLIERSSLARVDPCVFDAGCIEAVAGAAGELGYSSKRMTSGAAHDAQVLSGVMPAAMIFIPSRGGVSHNVTEYSTPEHIEAGANVLLLTLLKQAGVANGERRVPSAE